MPKGKQNARASPSFESDSPPAAAECGEPGNQATAAAGDSVETEDGSLGIVANLSLARCC